MTLEHWIGVEESIGFLLRRADEGLVATNGEEAQVRGFARLSRAEHVAFLTQTQIGLGQLETVCRLREGLQPREPRLGEFVSMSPKRPLW